MNQFNKDLDWQKAIRDKTLAPYYKFNSYDGRFIFADKGKLADILQKELAIDTVLQKQDGKLLSIEEKIVRWPGKEYTAMTLETWSCTTPGRERKGWMYTAQCDWLFYCFVQLDDSIIGYAMPFDKLKKWFFENNRYEKYPKTKTTQINETECRVVPIADILRDISETRRLNIHAPQEAAVRRG